MEVALKVCGMRDAENVDAVGKLGPDYMGFIAYPKSPRYIGPGFDRRRMESLPESVKKVGVFVNASPFEVADFAMTFGFDLAQLHGDETPEACRRVRRAGIPVIKAFGVDAHFDFSRLRAYEDCVDFFLFDTKTEGYGGSGRRFDWGVLEKYDGAKPVFLSGGLDARALPELPKLARANVHALDLNSRFETEPALKDVNQLKEFFKALKA